MPQASKSNPFFDLIKGHSVQAMTEREIQPRLDNAAAAFAPVVPIKSVPLGLEVSHRLSLYRDMFKAAGAIGADNGDMDVSYNTSFIMVCLL
jgi:hypothetical protein